ncbi:MAG: tyrosine-protein kinase family protein [Rhodocyclales bacterium GT-UBC]|nr:MAG: tyrosine-protein kinase family protein [Rhodocyclales bacterium GT-UBC]
MNLIEQAAKRLEQLRQAGVDMPDDPPKQVTTVKTEHIAEAFPIRGEIPDVIAPTNHPTTKEAPAALASRSKYVEIDLEAIAASGLLVPHAKRSQLADEFRVIKRPLIANAMGKTKDKIANGNLIMITSALPGEGKSFTAINVAISIAMELDNTVMLVDADVARPSVLNMLGLPPAQGLLDVLDKNSVDISDVLIKTNIEKLSILPSGTQHPRATELLASDTMVRLLDDMASRYNDRIIIFDSPPLLLTTEARTIATHMGQVVLVVNAGKTTQSAVLQAVSTIEACPFKMTILNQSRQKSSDSYGYGYGYGYGNEN